MKRNFTTRFLGVLVTALLVFDAHAQTPYVHYTFDTDGSDVMTNVDLTVGPNVTFVTDPDRGSVVQTEWDDAAGVVTLDVDGSWFTASTTEYTISTWFRYEDRNNWFGAIFAYGKGSDLANTYTYLSPAAGGESRLGLYDNHIGYTDGISHLYAQNGGIAAGSPNKNSADNDYSSSQWHHVAVTYKGTDVRVYLDGASWVTGTSSVSLVDQILEGIDTYKIGRNVHSGNQAMSARYDDFKVYHTALSPIDIATEAGTLITYNGSFSETPDGTSAVSVEADYMDDADLEVASLVVTSGNTMTVKSGRTLTVGSYLAVEGTLVVESGASLVTSGDVVGDVTIERNTTFDVATGKYSIVGAPVSDATTNSLGTSALVYNFDEEITDVSDNSLNRYVPVTAGSPMMPGVGYFSAFTGDANGAISFTGSPNTGSIDVPVTQTVDGFNLLSNPYPAAIDIATFMADGDNSELTGSVYIWDDNNTPGTRGSTADYITVNSSGVVDFDSEAGGNSFDGKLRSVQGFFVEATTTGTVTFKESHRASAANDDASFFRKDGIDFSRFKLAITNNEFYSETLLAFREEATGSVDRLYDARKIESQNSVQIYSLIEGEAFTIQSLPVLNEAISVPIGLNVEFSGSYEISLHALENMPSGINIRLIDNELGKSYNLSEAITLNLSSGKHLGRYSISLSASAVLDIDDRLKSGLKVYSIDGQTKVWLPGLEGAVRIETFDLLGHKLNSIKTKMTDGQWEGQLNIDKGILIMTLSTEGGSVFTTKFLSE